MKVTALGVTGAFSAGNPVEAIQTEEFIKEISLMENFSKDNILDLIKLKSKKLFNPKWQSNFLIEFDQPSIRDGKSPYRLCFDAGSDIKNSLANQNMNFSMIDGYYFTHRHGDHIGGSEGIALSTFFNPYFSKQKTNWLDNEYVIDKISNLPFKDKYKLPEGMKPEIYGHKDVINDLWRTSIQGLSTFQGVRKVCFETFFSRRTLIPNFKPIRFMDGKRKWIGWITIAIHVVSGDAIMPSYGIMFECSDGQNVFFPSDTQIMSQTEATHYKKADVIFADCETAKNKSGVHPHEDELRALDDEITKKMILYHYQDEPNNSDGKFKGIARIGDTWEF